MIFFDLSSVNQPPDRGENATAQVGTSTLEAK